ncbi:hypothetical protein [Staphylospora marina]|uniref:hypothetical protein n=1 Tax=Staphylospora marina TaxID=2490858 RepID=UPI000F5BCA4F|nr:hypothetical protein [Staphylospora marina]
MTMRYIPRIRGAAVPEEGQWATLSGKPVLILSVPEWQYQVRQSVEKDRHVWMYDRENDAYLFCFRMQNESDYAVAFPREHAGLLLRDPKADRPFSVLITSQELEGSRDLRPCLLFRDVRLRRHPRAGW